MRTSLIIFWLLFSCGIVLRFFAFPLGIILITLFATLLSIFYALFGFKFFTGIRKMFSADSYRCIRSEEYIIAAFYGLLFCVTLIGIQMRFRLFVDANLTIIFGLIGLLFLVFFAELFFHPALRTSLKKVWVHFLTLYLFGSLSLLIPNEKYTEMAFPDYPEIQHAYACYLNDPDNVKVEHTLDSLLNDYYERRDYQTAIKEE